MSITTIIVMIVAAIVGYFLVSGLFPDSPRKQGLSLSKDDPAGMPASAPRLDMAYIQQHWHTILGVAVSATRHEISQAYQQKLAHYHPQHFTGFTVDMQQLAAQHTQQIKAAYQYAISLKGFNDL